MKGGLEGDLKGLKGELEERLRGGALKGGFKAASRGLGALEGKLVVKSSLKLSYTPAFFKLPQALLASPLKTPLKTSVAS